jgi:hypothetical protein
MRAAALAIAVLLFAACVDAEFLDCNLSPDASVCARDAADAGFDAGRPDAGPPRCDPRAPFESVVELVELGAGASGARLSDDELTLYFARDDGTGSDLYVATRAARGDPFENIARIEGFDTAQDEIYPSVARGGLQLYAWVGSIASGEGGVAVGTRAAIGDPFRTVLPIVPLGAGSWSPFALPDASAVYAMYYPSMGDGDIVRFDPRAGDVQRVQGDSLDTFENEGHPVLHVDERTMYFCSDRHIGGLGDHDVYVTVRTSSTEPFREPFNLGASINSVDFECPSYVSIDGCELFFVRGAGEEATQLRAVRSPP